MTERTKLSPAQSLKISVFSTGCHLFDTALGGGYPEGRMINIIGDKSSGKTLLAIEGAANFMQKHPVGGDTPHGEIRYNEAESAFDVAYAEGLGLPVKNVLFAADHNLGIEDASETIEGLFEYIQKIIELAKEDPRPRLLIVDSMDAFSDRAEKSRDIDAGSYGANKAKKLSELFRREVTALEKANITFLIISQVRENIGVSFGKKTTRSGGKALDFYASQIIELAHIGRVKKTHKGQERATGVKVRAQVAKNKVGVPFREATYNILFGYGIDDTAASSDWLASVGKDALPWEELGLPKAPSAIALTNFQKKMLTLPMAEFLEKKAILDNAVTKEWNEIEEALKAPRGKY